MARYVVFRLYGPMAAWGDIAVGERRPIRSSPSRSGVLGLLGAALGVRREDAEGQRALHEDNGFAALVEQPGSLLTDYHTAQSPAEKLIKTPPIRRADELNFPRGERGLQTILSWRDYQTDAMALGCIWPLRPESRWSVERLIEALKRPFFTLYLGRKGCPLALPLCPVLVEAPHPVQALQQPRPASELAFLHGVGLRGRSSKGPPEYTIFWEGEDGSLVAQRREPRRDRVRNRSRWQFMEREERSASWSPEQPPPAGEQDEEELS